MSTALINIFIIIFAAVFILLLICIFVFRKHKQNFISQIDKETLSLRFVLGFSAWCADLYRRLPFAGKSPKYEKKKQLLSALTPDTSAEKNMYLHHIKLASYFIAIALICSFLGLVYTVSLSTHEKETITNITRPITGEGSQNISLITDSETFSGRLELTVDEKKYTFDEAMDIFSHYRAEFDNYVLGDNTSFLYITTPINLPSSWGDENISVTWDISNPDIIDYSGNINTEALTEEGSALEIIASLTLTDITADICYELVVYPPDEASDEAFKAYINEYINSAENITRSDVTLPSEYNGQAIVFYEDREVYPSVDIHCWARAFADSYHCLRKSDS